MNFRPIALVSLMALASCQPTVNQVTSTQDNNPRSAAVIEASVESLLTQMTLDEKISMVHASGKFHVNSIERLGIPEMWLSDGPHGVRQQIERHSWNYAGWDDDHSTYLPHLTSVASSWDHSMAELHGHVLGSEARERQKDIILGPGVNLARLTLYGRNFEYMGEDPFLAARLVVPEIKAIQSHDVAANAKHYALNTQELNRTGVNATPDERTLREVYLPVFEAAVKEGNVYSIMGAYNEYNGTNANQSKHLVKDILKDEWGFDGVLLTDWNVDINTYDAAMNGLDLEMGTKVDSYDDYFLAEPFKNAILAGEIPVSVLDDKVRRVLRLQHRVGMYDPNRKTGQRNTKKHQQDARTIAANGVILLKNKPVAGDPVLPLAKSSLKKVLVMGPNADKKHGQGGGSSEVKSLYEVTPLEGIKNALGKDVEIITMRARSAKLSPIASDYIASRHWTGTPAWNIGYFADEALSQLKEESWIVDAQFNNDTAVRQHIRMKAKLAPLATGDHIFKFGLKGTGKVTIDGNLILNVASEDDYQEVQHTQALEAGTSYDVVIEYHGVDSVTLGWDAPGNLFNSESDYIAAAKSADAVIYVGGLSHGDDRESIDRKDMVLPFGQDEIINKLLDANPKTIVLMVAGSAVEMPWHKKSNALLWGWYGGMEAGNAFADVIFGDVNPNAKLPITLPESLAHTAPIMLDDYSAETSEYKEGVFYGYRWLEKNNIDPMFAFGHGLSYTEFKYSNISLSSDEFILDRDNHLAVEVTVRNTGKRAGAEIVQLYLNDADASVERPNKELRGFGKVHLQPGESKRVKMLLDQRALSFWDTASNNWKAETGRFDVLIGSSSDKILLKATFDAVN